MVAGEGNGHATRSAAIIDCLHQEGHEVAAVSDGQALDILNGVADELIEAVTPHIVYDKNSVKGLRTIWRNLQVCPQFFLDLQIVKRFVAAWNPRVVISDFNPMASFIRGIPLVSIDNQGILSQGKIEIPRGHWLEYAKSRLVCATVVPSATVRVVSSFMKVPVRTGVVRVGPILSRKVWSLKSRRRSHVVVYQTSPTHTCLAELLPKLGIDIAAYGFGRQGRIKQVRFKPFDSKGWMDDLSSCRAVIMNGGYSLITEALVLGKPVLCFPVQHQFEQVLNAYYLEKEGLGVWGRQVSVSQIHQFLNEEKVMRERIKERSWEDGAVQAVDVVKSLLR